MKLLLCACFCCLGHSLMSRATHKMSDNVTCYVLEAKQFKGLTRRCCEQGAQSDILQS